MPLPGDGEAARRRAFAAAFFAWALDGFDATILTFVLLDIQHQFRVDNALAGALGTVQLVFRVAGGIGAGTAADRWGRKGPLLFSVVWYSVFAGLSGFSTSYRMLFALRALFGIGMGGVWAAGMPLAIEHWPARLRGLVSGLLQGAYSVGYIVAAMVFQIGYPRLDADRAWRVLLWIGIVPAIAVCWMTATVRESPEWRPPPAPTGKRVQPLFSFSIVRLFSSELLPATIQTSLVMAGFMVAYQSMTFWYPRFLALSHREPLPYLIALNAGGIAGAAMWGRLSETGLGRRGAFTLAMALGIAATPLYLFGGGGAALWLGALAIGLFAAGSLGVMPGYLLERFPTSARAAGAGFAYHVGAGIGAFAPYLVGAFQDRGFAIAPVMTAAIVGGGLVMILCVWLGPETRGRNLT